MVSSELLLPYGIISMASNELLLKFLKKYKIKNYSLIKYEQQISNNGQLKYVIFNDEENYYYKVFCGGKPHLQTHAFLNHAHFPNHLVLSIIDTELNIWIIKSSPAPGVALSLILKTKENTLDKTFIIKMMEWFKWQHTESRRIFPSITDKYFVCTGIFNDAIDLHAHNLMYDTETHCFTPIDFEQVLIRSFISTSNWVSKNEYILYTFNSINEVLRLILLANSNNSNGWLSFQEYPKLLDYCIEYVYKEIL